MTDNRTLYTMSALAKRAQLTYEQLVRLMLRLELITEYLVPVHFPDGTARYESILWPTERGKSFCFVPDSVTHRPIRWDEAVLTTITRGLVA
jgi:hypothetical protein